MTVMKNKVMLAPKRTEGTVPINFAATPDSKAPNSLEQLTNTPLMELTLPLISSGGNNCNMVCLTTTLMLSNAPVKNSATSDK